MIKLISDSFALSKGNTFVYTEEIAPETSPSKVFIDLEIHGENAKRIFDGIKGIFEDHFFSTETEVLLRFEECMKKINDFVKDLDNDLSGIIAGQEGSELHISQTGKGEAYLIRKNKLNVIIENISNEEENKEERFTSIASGDLHIDDKVIITSLRLLRYATASQLVSILSEGISEGIDALQDVIELETQVGGVMCFHVKGKSIFTQMDGSDLPRIPKHLRASFLSNLVVQFERAIHFISEKSGKSYETVQNIVFGALATFVSVVLIGSVAFVSVDNAEKAKAEEYKTKLLKTEKELQIAETRAQMNEITSANAILDKVETDVKAMLTEGVFVDEGLTILERVQNQRDTANKISRFKDMEQRVLVNIFTESKGEKIKDLVTLGKDTYAVTQKSLFKTVLNHVEPGVKVSSTTDEIVRAKTVGDRNTLFLTLSNGVRKEFVNGQIVAATTTDTNGFKNSISEAGYNRFLYFLSPQDNQIWKYERQRDGYSSASPWLTEKTSVADAIDLGVDGSIYVLKKEGGVSLFYKGSETRLNINGGSQDLLKKATKIFVKPEMKNVYFLNPARNSVIVFTISNKGLDFKKEYVFETPSKLVNFYVDQNETRMVLADEQKLYEITL